jgi:hypothetical protein
MLLLQGCEGGLTTYNELARHYSKHSSCDTYPLVLLPSYHACSLSCGNPT